MFKKRVTIVHEMNLIIFSFLSCVSLNAGSINIFFALCWHSECVCVCILFHNIFFPILLDSSTFLHPSVFALHCIVYRFYLDRVFHFFFPFLLFIFHSFFYVDCCCCCGNCCRVSTEQQRNTRKSRKRNFLHVFCFLSSWLRLCRGAFDGNLVAGE